MAASEAEKAKLLSVYTLPGPFRLRVVPLTVALGTHPPAARDLKGIVRQELQKIFEATKDTPTRICPEDITVDSAVLEG